MDPDGTIAYIRLYRQKAAYMHWNILPFFATYFAWVATWITNGFGESQEVASIALAVIAVGQIFTCLSCVWSIHVRCLMNCTPVRSILAADSAKVVPTANNGEPELVRIFRGRNEDGSCSEWIVFQKSKYVYDHTRNSFMPIHYPLDLTFREYSEQRGLGTTTTTGKSVAEWQSGVEWQGWSAESVRAYYDDNRMEFDIPAFTTLFRERATAPFFVFQVFCVCLWCMDEYWYYSLFTLALLIVFECTLVSQQLRNMSEIRKMGNRPFTMHVYRAKRWSMINSSELLPGDLVSIVRPSDTTRLVPCDLLLLRGQCIVDEAMLTGESVPVAKESIEQELDVYSDDRLSLAVHGKLHVVFGGTRIVQHSSNKRTEGGGEAAIRTPDGGCLCFVLTNGFATNQGRLLKTILYSVKRATANNVETFMFILFLLAFAVCAAVYVWTAGIADPSRNRFTLFIECTLILTSVVPPELPIELSLAVNNSLLALARLGVFCTEPFRIPFAGKTDYCCFDKTGTLTSSDLSVEGVAGLSDDADDASPNALQAAMRVRAVAECPIETQQVLATCHSLAFVDFELIGDPLEKAGLRATEWTLTKNEVAIPPARLRSAHSYKIYQRFHFNSTLKRMAVVAGFTPPGTTDTSYIVAVKGAPEVLRSMLCSLPPSYDTAYRQLALQRSRILTLAYRSLGVLSHQQVRELTRPNVERDLHFAGFLITTCPLKPDSEAAIRELHHAAHHVIMITGDSPLTACCVARQLNMARKPCALILQRADQPELDAKRESTANDASSTRLVWRSVDESVTVEHELVASWAAANRSREARDKLRSFLRSYDLCLTGESLAALCESPIVLRRLVPFVKIYARVSPKQKERVVTELNALGLNTLMCGDGTNDVGALKHAHCGIALLNAPSPTPAPDAGTAASPPVPTASPDADSTRAKRGDKAASRANAAEKAKAKETAANAHLQRVREAQQKWKDALADIDKEQQAQIVRLGDASIAAPFTSRLSSVQSVCHIVKQGRCTLVTTQQMFKVLALNALVLAYSQSVLYVDGIKFGDMQVTLQGLLLAGCFLFISRSKPLRTLSRKRPLSNIFNPYMLLTVCLQFALHFLGLVFLVREAHVLQIANSTGTLNQHALSISNLLSGKAGFALLPNDSHSMPHILDEDDEFGAVAADAAQTFVPLSDDLTNVLNSSLPALNSTGGIGGNATANVTSVMERHFEPNLVNSVVYLVSVATQVITFAVNYKGYPFMESLIENRPLFYSLVLSGSAFVALTLQHEPFDEFAQQFSLVRIPLQFGYLIVAVMLADMLLAFLIDRVLQFVCGYGRLKP